MPNTPGGDPGATAVAEDTCDAAPGAGFSLAISAGAMSRENPFPALTGAGTLCGPCRKQQRCSSWQGRPLEASSIAAASVDLLDLLCSGLCPGQHGSPAGMT
jgi:hypothetical protein